MSDANFNGFKMLNILSENVLLPYLWRWDFWIQSIAPTYRWIFLTTHSYCLYSSVVSWRVNMMRLVLLSFSQEKCALIRSHLAATQGQGFIDNQSLWQVVNCPGCTLGALGALSTCAGRDKSSLLFFLCAYLQPIQEFQILCKNVKYSQLSQWKEVAAHFVFKTHDTIKCQLHNWH